MFILTLGSAMANINFDIWLSKMILKDSENHNGD